MISALLNNALDIALPLCVGLIVLWAPGLAIGVCARLPRALLWGAAPAASVAIIGSTAVVAPLLHLRWALWEVAASTTLCALGILAVRATLIAIFRRKPAHLRKRFPMIHALIRSDYPPLPTDRVFRPIVFRLLLLGALLAASAAGFAKFLAATGSMHNFIQSWDASYHLNEIQAIIQTGNGSSLNAILRDPNAAGFYPNGYHDVASLIAMTTGYPVPATGQLTIMIFAFVALPAGVAALAYVATGREIATLIAALCALAFPAYPLAGIWWSAMYSNVAATALLPGAIAVAAWIIKHLRGRLLPVPLLYAAVCSVGVGITQPNAFISWLIVVWVCLGWHVGARYASGAHAAKLTDRATKLSAEHAELATIEHAEPATVPAATMPAEPLPRTAESASHLEGHALHTAQSAAAPAVSISRSSRSARTRDLQRQYPQMEHSRTGRSRIARASAALIVWIAITIALWSTLVMLLGPERIAGMNQRKPQGTLLEGILSGGTAMGAIPYWPVGQREILLTLPLSVLLIVGIIAAAMHSELRWLVASYGVLLALFAITFSSTWPPFRNYISGVWYSDLPRLLSLLVIMAPVFVGIAVAQFHSLAKCRSALLFKRFAACAVTTVGILSVMVWALKLPAWNVPWEYLTFFARQGTTHESYLVDRDEYQLFLKMRDILPPDALIIGNPWEGETFAWAISGRRVLIPQLYNRGVADYPILSQHMSEGASNPQVCKEIKKYGITHALDLEPTAAPGGKLSPGFDNLANGKLGPVIAQVGAAKLVKITLCDVQ
ncbi:MAG: DUF6541 family protein [Arcanobacterium sp.]|nr:DUF6541 family protein [Arcanobacterium sp.]